MKTSTLFIIFVLIIFLVRFERKKEPLPPLIVNPVEVDTPKPVQNIARHYDLEVPKAGEAEDLVRKQHTKIKQVSQLGENARYGYFVTNYNQQIFAYAKPATSNEMYFVNGYLNGFVPYKVDNMWVILQYLQTRLKYQLDEVGYNDRKEVWQTAKESYVKLRGDCEDHALLLADWLIGLGYDARVVVGTAKSSGKTPVGHAWVVLFNEGNEYLLEATKKSKWNAIPLASTQPNYFPKYMFNRTEFWVNEGTILTTNYADEKWKKSGKFIPHNPYYKDLENMASSSQ